MTVKLSTLDLLQWCSSTKNNKFERVRLKGAEIIK